MTKKEIIDKVYDDYLKDYGRVGYIGMNSIEKACKSEFEKNGIEYDHYDVQEALESNLNEIYDKCIKDNIGDISKEPKEIQMAAKMHSFMEDYDKAYRDMNDYLEGKTTKLNEGKNMNQYAVTRAFENVIICHDGDLVITDKHVEIGKNYDIPRTNS